VRGYYAQFGEREWDRLADPADGAIEFAINSRAIARHLPAGARVLDIGGGPGRYAIWLAERGHHVVLADLSDDLLGIARRRLAAAHPTVQQAIEDVVAADACDLSRWEDGSFDAAVCLGPFYHLPAAADRERAASELARVVRPGGVVFVAFMPRFALLRRTLSLPDERHRITQPAWVARLLDDGVFENDVDGRFTAGYGARPEEIAPFFARHGFRKLTLLSSQGITLGFQPETLRDLAADRELLAQALELIMATAADPSLLGGANHLLYVGQRPG
jgi:S-adenosylmethionine-dependent methyltransferase